MSQQDARHLEHNDERAQQGEFRCDALGCNEWHPLVHDCLGEPCFATGRWLGWLYLDLNRPDVFPRELRFCSVRCLEWWLDRTTMRFGRRPRTALDEALDSPDDELKRRAAIKSMTTDDDEEVSA